VQQPQVITAAMAATGAGPAWPWRGGSSAYTGSLVSALMAWCSANDAQQAPLPGGMRSGREILGHQAGPTALRRRAVIRKPTDNGEMGMGDFDPRRRRWLQPFGWRGTKSHQ
jgi:hypothetical protein